MRGAAADAAEQAYRGAGRPTRPARRCSTTPAAAALGRPAPSGPNGWSATGSAACWTWSAREAGDKRVVARARAYAVNGVGLVVMIAVFTSTAFIPTGAEIAVGRRHHGRAQKVLEAIFGDQADPHAGRPGPARTC